MPSNSADIFRYSELAYDEQFIVILEGIVVAFNNMLLDFSSIENKETTIRNYLCKNYLQNDIFREKYFLIPFSFDAESAIIMDGHEIGYIDIKIKTAESFQKTQNYYTVECKRLDGDYVDRRKTQPILKNNSLATEYIKNGIMRFVTKKYPTALGVNGMIAFIVKATDIDEGVSAINDLIKNKFKETNTSQLLTKVDIITEFDFAYFSSHLDTDNDSFDLYHLMLDYSGIIKK